MASDDQRPQQDQHPPDSQQEYDFDPTEPEDDLDDPAYTEALVRRQRAQRGKVLLWALGFVASATLLYAAFPYIVSPYVSEGPMVQQPGENRATLVWFMTRTPGPLRVAYGPEDARQSVDATCIGRACRAVLTGLAPASEVHYEIIDEANNALAAATLKTNKPPNTPFTFAVFGDSGKATRAQYIIANRVAGADPDFVLHTGDVVYPGGERSRYDSRFFHPYRNTISRVALWPCIGNHDLNNELAELPYFSVFDLPTNGPAQVHPERCYWFEYADARIASIDSEMDETALRDHVAPWLRSVFADSPARWNFVIFHRPAYLAGAHDPSEKLLDTIVPVIEKVGVDFVFNGHDHNYQRLGPIRNGARADTGVWYIVTGAGGAQLYELAPENERPDYFHAGADNQHSFTLVTIDGDNFKLKQVGVDGLVIEEWTWTKPASTSSTTAAAP